jgi:hypothetical protein
MKKIFIATVALFTLATTSFAQTAFRLGAKVGANLNKIDGQSFNDGYNLGYQAGGFAEIDFGKLGIQPEVLFSQSKTKYAKSTSEIADIKAGDNITLDYLSIPVLLRINAGKLLTFVVGPQFSVLTNNHKTTAQNAGDAFKSGDFSMAGGAQVNLKMFRVYGRYNVGLNNINDVSNQENWKSQQLQLGIGLKL